MTRKIDEYSLHVRRDGRELRFRQGPEWCRPLGSAPMLLLRQGNQTLPVHRVVVLELEDGTVIEQTEIPNIKVNYGEKIICPKPHGHGWKVHDNASDKVTVYRRPVPKSKRPMFGSLSDALQN